VSAPAWQRRFRAARVSLPSWASGAPHRLAYATNASGVWQVRSWDLETEAHTDLTDKPTGVLGGAPTPDGTGVVWFDDGAGDEIGRYVVTPFHGGEPRPLIPSLPTGWSMGVALRGNRRVVGLGDRDGFSIHLAEGTGDRVRELYRHRQPASVGGLSRDGRYLAVSHTEHGDTLHPRLFVFDCDAGEIVAELEDGPGVTVSPAAWSRVPGDPRLAVLSDRSGRHRPEIWDGADGTRTALDIDLPGEVWVADWWPDGAALLLGHDHLGRTSLHRFDLADGRRSALDLGDGTIRGARVRPDGAIWYAFNSSAKPSQVRTREADGTDRALLVPPGEPAPEGVAFRSLHYDNGIGDRVHAFLAVPGGPSRPGPLPLVVDAHGGPHAQTEDAFDPQVQAWVDHGFAVLMPNYRGSTGYGKAWEDALAGDPGRPELEDLLAGLHHVVGQGLADPERAVIVGGSWGGYLALQAVGTQPEAWTAAVAIVPVADYVAAFEDESPHLQEFDRSLFGGTPEDLPDLYAERSPISHVDRVRAPVLIITGRNDTRCPIRQVDNYVAALEQRGVPHTYDVFEAGHGSLAVEESIRQQALMLDFLAEHLGTPPAQRS
jgi:acetyl esterase/lipase